MFEFLLLLTYFLAQLSILLRDHLFDFVLFIDFLTNILLSLFALNRFYIFQDTVINLDFSIFERVLEIALTYRFVEFLPEYLNILLDNIPFFLEHFLRKKFLDVFEEKLNFFCNIVVVIGAYRALR